MKLFKNRALQKSAIVITLIMALAVALSLTGACAPAEQEEEEEPQTVEWRCASFMAWGDPGQDMFKTLVADAISDESEGALDITLFGSSEVVPYDKIAEAVASGAVEMGLVAGCFWTDQMPVGEIDITVPMTWGGFESGWAGLEFMRTSGIEDIVAEAYAELGIHHLGYSWTAGCPYYYSTAPIRSLDDFKPLLIEAEGAQALLLEEIGVATAVIPIEDRYMALKLGTVDAIEYDQGAMLGMNWYEVTDYFIKPAWNQPVFVGAIVNMDDWNSLSPDVQEVLNDLFEAYVTAFGESVEALLQELDDRADELGYEVITLPDSEMDKLRDIAVQKIWPVFAAKDQYCADVIEILKDHYGYE